MRAIACFSQLIRVLSLLCAVVLLVSAAVRAVVHLRDLSGIQHIAGIWMALAQYGNAGVLYPPLEADGFYAGTRYMPLCFGLIAGLVRIVGDYVVAAKLMALASMVLLLAGVFVAVRRLTGRALDALLLTGLVLASPEARTALLSPHADALAAALTLAGLLLIDRGRAGLAALLFTAALMTKFSAIAGPVAAGVFLLRHDRKRALGLLLSWFVLTASGLVLLEHFSDGRFLDNFRSLGSGGMSLDSIRIGPARVAFALGQSLPFSAVLALAVFALLGAAANTAWICGTDTFSPRPRSRWSSSLRPAPDSTISSNWRSRPCSSSPGCSPGSPATRRSLTLCWNQRPDSSFSACSWQGRMKT